MKNKIYLFLLLLIAFKIDGQDIYKLDFECRERLDSLLKENKITAQQFDIFSKQINFRAEIGLQSRLDSMKMWDVDIVYIEESFFPAKDSSFIEEYYFSSIKEMAKLEKDEIKNYYQSKKYYHTHNYYPEKYFMNGTLLRNNGSQINQTFYFSKWFFRDENGKDHLRSIRNHMQTRKLADKIVPLVKIDYETAGCGLISKNLNRYSKKKDSPTKREYEKRQIPDYYLIETLVEKKDLKVSFQIPVKTKSKVIIEYHSF